MAHGPEFPVKDLCLRYNVFLVIFRSHVPHGIGHGIHDDRILVPAGFLHEIGIPADLVDTDRRKQQKRYSDQHDIHPKNFTAQTVFHKDLPPLLLPGFRLQDNIL